MTHTILRQIRDEIVNTRNDLGARIDGVNESLGARIDSLNESLGARIDITNERLAIDDLRERVTRLETKVG